MAMFSKALNCSHADHGERIAHVGSNSAEVRTNEIIKHP
jgi:hypothetical protein